MNRQEYVSTRNKLYSMAKTHIQEEKYKEFELIEQQILELDKQYQGCNSENMNNNENGGVTLENIKSTQEKRTEQEYLNVWAKVMMGAGLTSTEKSLFEKVNYDFKNSVQTAATHDVLIPEKVTNDIWREAGELYPILGDIRMTFVPGDLTIIKEANSGDDADWYDEDTKVVDGRIEFEQINLSGCELAKSIPISWKLKKMSVEVFIPYITSLLAEKMGAAFAKAIVRGKGKPTPDEEHKAQPKGIITVIESEEEAHQIITYDDAEDKLDYDKMAKAMGKIKSQYINKAVVYAKNSTIWNRLALIKDKNDRPLFVPDVTSGGVGRILGLPVKVEDSLGEDEILIGNVSKGYAANINENMTIYTDDHKKERFTDYMGYAIVDGDVVTSRAFVLIKKISE